MFTTGPKRETACVRPESSTPVCLHSVTVAKQRPLLDKHCTAVHKRIAHAQLGIAALTCPASHSVHFQGYR